MNREEITAYLLAQPLSDLTRSKVELHGNKGDLWRSIHRMKIQKIEIVEALIRLPYTYDKWFEYLGVWRPRAFYRIITDYGLSPRGSPDTRARYGRASRKWWEGKDAAFRREYCTRAAQAKSAQAKKRQQEILDRIERRKAHCAEQQAMLKLRRNQGGPTNDDADEHHALHGHLPHGR